MRGGLKGHDGLAGARWNSLFDRQYSRFWHFTLIFETVLKDDFFVAKKDQLYSYPLFRIRSKGCSTRIVKEQLRSVKYVLLGF